MGSHTHDDYPYCLYYYCAFDGGMRQMMTMMRSNIDSQKRPGMLSHIAKKMLTEMFVNKSIQQGFERPKDWKATASHEPEESSSLIRKILTKIKVHGKKKADYFSLEELLTGDKDKLLETIRLYRQSQPDAVSLGYLFYLLSGRPAESTRSINDQENIDRDFMLVRRVHIRPCAYMTFCNAVTDFLKEKRITDIKRIREKYLMCKCGEDGLKDDAEDFREYRTQAWRNAREVMRKWFPVFNEID